MKVLQLNAVYAFGSTGYIVKDLKELIDSQDEMSAIIYGRGNLFTEKNIWKIGSELDCKLHVLYARLTDKVGFASSFCTNKMVKKIREYKPDIIHLHNIHGYWINIEILFNFLKEYGKPVVWTLHDCWAFTGHCAHYDAINCDKWLTECKQCPQIGEYPKSLKDNSLENFYQKKIIFNGVKNLHIVTPSQWLQREVKKSFLKTYPCHVIANGIDLNKFRVKDFVTIKHSSKKIKILGVASIWGKRKGLYDFVKLAQILNLDDYEITVVGVNDKQKDFLVKYGIIAIVRTNDFEKLVKLYQKADVFFNPTYEDNFPTTNLEALACGTPVLTYKTGGSPESLTSQCGVIVDKGDLNTVAYHLKRWKSYEFQVADCVERAKFFDKFLKFNEYYQLYKNITAENAQSVE